MNNNLKTYLFIALLLVSGIAGFFIGRSNQTIKEKTFYVPGKPIHDTIPFPYPVKEVYTHITENLVPGKVIHDTIKNIIIRVDTPSIVKDYFLERTYKQKFFDDNEKGKLIVNSTVQYNKQTSLSIDYTPMIKQTDKITKPIYTPFVSAGYNTLNQIEAGAGIYYHNAGIEVNYIYDTKTKNNSYGGKFLIKF